MPATRIEAIDQLRAEIKTKDAEIANLTEKLTIANRRIAQLLAGRPTGIAAVDRATEKWRRPLV